MEGMLIWYIKLDNSLRLTQGKILWQLTSKIYFFKSIVYLGIGRSQAIKNKIYLLNFKNEFRLFFAM